MFQMLFTHHCRLICFIFISWMNSHWWLKYLNKESTYINTPIFSSQLRSALLGDTSYFRALTEVSTLIHCTSSSQPFKTWYVTILSLLGGIDFSSLIHLLRCQPNALRYFNSLRATCAFFLFFFFHMRIEVCYNPFISHAEILF